MSGRVNLLSVLLAVQLVVIAAVLLTESGFGGAEEAGPFLGFEADAVNEIRITGEDDDAATLVLERAEDGWRLPNGFPADAGKVDEVLDRLAGLRAPWPVATSGGAAERFQVSSDEFQRHVVLMADGDAVADLYLGSSPGYQQVHARRADDDGVYSVGISNYQLPAKSDEWLDKTLLQARGKISAVERLDAWRLHRGEEGWLVGELAADQEAAAELVRRLSELRVTGTGNAPPTDSNPTAVLSVTDEEGSYQLSFFGDEEGNQYQVSSDRREGNFGLAGYLAEQLLVEEQALLPSDDEESTASEDEGSAVSGEGSAASAEGEAPADTNGGA
jgi:hypothetical protein